jgi:hypothetical protein
MLNLGAVGRPWRQSGIDRLWHSQHSQSGSVISHQGSAARHRHTLGHEGNWGRGGTLPRRHPEAGGDYHPLPGPSQ